MLYDSGYVIMKQFDVLFRPEESILSRYEKKFGDQLKTSHSDDSQRLPVPATFILDKNGIVKWRHFDTNYRIRSNVADIMKNLE